MKKTKYLILLSIIAGGLALLVLILYPETSFDREEEAVSPTTPLTPQSPTPAPNPGTSLIRVTSLEPINTAEYNVRVVELLEDSRCPVDVTCIQAGTVRVKLEINDQEVVLALEQSQSLSGMTVTLTQVEPIPYSNRERKLEEYVFYVTFN